MRNSLLLFLCLCGAARGIEVQSRHLPNGVEIQYVQVPGSTGLSVYSFLPAGLANDDDGCAQYSHLLEHMVIRTTSPQDSPNVNAETLADHMRLDYYGSAANWREAVSHHTRWLAELPFDANILKREIARANSEVDFTAQNLMSHKFAVAAWNQAWRFGHDQVTVRLDPARITMMRLQRYRDTHFNQPGRTLVTAIGGAEPVTILSAFSQALGKAHAGSRPVPCRSNPAPADKTVAWDLSSRHLIMTWPIPGPALEKEYAALITAAQWLISRAYVDPEWKKLTGPVLAGADLVTPETAYFYLSATLQPGTPAEAVRRKFDALVASLENSPELKAAAPFYGDIPPEEVLQKLTVPTLFIAGERDAWINPEKVKGLKEIAAKYKLPLEAVSYDADHAFFNDTRPEVYNAEAAADAWKKVLEHFRKHLGGTARAAQS